MSRWRTQLGRGFSKPAAARGDAAIGVAEKVGTGLLAGDFSLSATAIARNRESQQGLPFRIQWYCGDVQELRLADACVDWILCFETVEHLPDPAKAIREFARVLRPRGRLVLTTPNYLNFAGLYRLYLRLSGRRFSEAGQPINRFTSVPRTFFWLWRAGLRVLKFDGRSHFVRSAAADPLLSSVSSIAFLGFPAGSRFRPSFWSRCRPGDSRVLSGRPGTRPGVLRILFLAPGPLKPELGAAQVLLNLGTALRQLGHKVEVRTLEASAKRAWVLNVLAHHQKEARVIAGASGPWDAIDAPAQYLSPESATPADWLRGPFSRSWST